MPPKKKPVDPGDVDAIWAAGVLSAGGSLKLVHTAKTRVVRYVLTSSLLPGMVDQLARISGSAANTLNQANATNESRRIAIQGAALHPLMTTTWPYLTLERKQQYAELRKQITSTTEGPNPYKGNDTEIEKFQEQK